MKSDDSIFTCSKCDKRLEYGYSMACLHTICRECFDVRDTTESHTCNICHVSHDKSAISNIDNLIAWNNARWKKKIKCTGCSENLPAVYHCQQCDDDLCSNCASAHGRVKFTKDHQLLEHEKMPNNFCSSHQDSKADFFCLTCESCYCVYCFLLKKHPASDDHRFCTDLEPAMLTKLKNLSESNFLDKMDKLCGASNLEKRKIDQDLDEIEKIANEWRSEFESTIELINALCRSRRTPLVEIKKRTEIMEKIMSQTRLYLFNHLALSNEQCFKEIEQLLTMSHQLFVKLSRTGDEYRKIVDRSKADILPTPNLSTFGHLRRMLTTKIASQNANLSPIPPHQNGIPLLPGIFGTPDDYQYAVSSGENSRAVGTSPECYEVPNPQQFSPTNSHLASTHQTIDPSLRIQYGFHTPSVYNDQFGTQSPNVHGAPMGPFMNQRFPFTSSPGTSAIYSRYGYKTPCGPPPSLTPNFSPISAIRHLLLTRPFSTKSSFPENQVKKRRRGGGAVGGQTARKTIKKNTKISNDVALSTFARPKESCASGPVQRVATSVNDSSQCPNIPTSAYCPDDLDGQLINCETPPLGLF